MKRILASTAFFALACPAYAETEATAEQIASVDKALVAMTCEVDSSNIEVAEDGSFDLDDVQCADGQYDIVLNADFTEKERRKE